MYNYSDTNDNNKHDLNYILNYNKLSGISIYSYQH